MLNTNINLGGKSIALTILFLFWSVPIMVSSLLLLAGIDAILCIVEIILYISNEGTPFITKMYIVIFFLTLINLLVVIFVRAIIPYLTYKLKKYNWIVYMCNFSTQCNSDDLIQMFDYCIPLEIFNEIKYDSARELNLFEEKLEAEDYDAVALLLSGKHHRSCKLRLTVRYMSLRANYWYIGTLLNNQYCMNDIFNALCNCGQNINFRFVDALLEHVENKIGSADLDIDVHPASINLLDYILTKIYTVDDILSKLDAYLIRALNHRNVHIDGVKILLKHGANPDGNLLIKIAKQQQGTEILDVLLQHGGDVTVNDHYIFRYSIAEKRHVLATYLANKYSFYHVMSDEDKLVGHISNISGMKSANNC